MKIEQCKILYHIYISDSFSSFPPQQYLQQLGTPLHQGHSLELQEPAAVGTYLNRVPLFCLSSLISYLIARLKSTVYLIWLTCCLLISILMTFFLCWLLCYWKACHDSGWGVAPVICSSFRAMVEDFIIYEHIFAPNQDLFSSLPHVWNLDGGIFCHYWQGQTEGQSCATVTLEHMPDYLQFFWWWRNCSTQSHGQIIAQHRNQTHNLFLLWGNSAKICSTMKCDLIRFIILIGRYLS